VEAWILTSGAADYVTKFLGKQKVPSGAGTSLLNGDSGGLY
jgi:hypothetical protein